ncbi:MAG: NOP5/NOP56 family protein [Candidatus Micrarchaeota archaeon]
MRERRPHRGNQGFRGNRMSGSQEGERFEKRARFMKRARQTVMQALRSRDMLLASVTKSIEDLDKTINLLGERFEDWYGIYFPELRAEEKLQYCNAALMIDKENLDEKGLAVILGQKRASELAAAAKGSLGAKLSPKDHSECLSMARAIITLEKLRKDYEAYQKELANELCPNMSEVGGPEIAAKLVSHVGSLQRLALLPSSAIQVLGAEKALFKHLRNRKIPPPKHGIIFQHVRISASPKSVRGKIARALANQLSLASKADAFSKRSISPALKKKFDDRYAEIMKEYEAQKSKAPSGPKP